MKTIFKALPLAAAAVIAASCNWDPIKNDIPAVDEKMVVTASADDVTILAETMADQKITFQWTPARQMPDDYYLSYVAKLDVLGNNFGSKTAIVNEFEEGENSITFTLAQINEWANERWGIPVNKEFYLEFRVVATWVGGSTFEIPEVKTVNVHVTPLKIIVFDADNISVGGTAVPLDQDLAKCPENQKVFALSCDLVPGELQIPVEYDGQTFYLAPKDRSAAFRDTQSMEIEMLDEPFRWNITKADRYRIVVNMEAAKAVMYSSENDLKPFETGVWYPANKDVNGTMESIAVTNLWLRGESADWAANGKDLQLQVSPADPQILVYSGAKLKGGRTDFSVISAYNCTKPDGTNFAGNVNNAFVFAPLKEISEMSGSDWNLGGLKEKTPYPMQGGSGTERGGYFKLPAGITFMVFNLREMTWMYEMR